MVDGRINKFYKEVCLLKQPFVKDGEIDVAEYIEKPVRDWAAPSRSLTSFAMKG